MTRHSAPLVSFTVAVSGPIKDSESTHRIFNYGVAALLALVKQSTWIVREQTALVSANGPEGLLSIRALIHNLKLAIIELEHPHPLGRLWDIDILISEGEVLSRRHLALPARRCLLCKQGAANYAQGKTYTLSDLLTQIETLLHDADSRNIDQ